MSSLSMATASHTKDAESGEYCAAAIMLLQALPRSPQCMAAALLAAPSTLLSAARGAAGALAEDAAEVTAEALCEGHALLREVLGLEAVRGWVLLPLQRLWRAGTVQPRASLALQAAESWICTRAVRSCRVAWLSRGSLHSTHGRRKAACWPSSSCRRVAPAQRGSLCGRSGATAPRLSQVCRRRPSVAALQGAPDCASTPACKLHVIEVLAVQPSARARDKVHAAVPRRAAAVTSGAARRKGA